MIFVRYPKSVDVSVLPPILIDETTTLLKVSIAPVNVSDDDNNVDIADAIAVEITVVIFTPARINALGTYTVSVAVLMTI